MQKQHLSLALLLVLFIGPQILLLSSNSLAIVQDPQEARDFVLSDGEAWLTGWQYRKELTITGATGVSLPDMTNYTVDLEINYGSGSDSGNVIYCNSHCRTDFADISFTNSTGNGLLSFWMEEYTLSDDGTFWVKVPDDLSTEQTIFLYYGNAAFNTSRSNGTETFLFFDDFENNNFNRWDSTSGNPAITSSTVKMGTYAAELYNAAAATTLDKTFAYDESFLIHAWLRANNAYRGPVLSQQATSYDSQWRIYGDDIAYYDKDVSAYVDYAQNEAASDGHWYRAELAYDFNQENNRAWKDRDSLGDPDTDFDDNSNNDITEIFSVQVYSQSAYYDYVDDYYIRKWTYYEPYISDSGEEEQAPAYWSVVNSVTITFVAGISEGTQWAYYSFILLVGAAMIPFSAIYLVWGGKKNFSTDKLFFGLLLFFLGWAVVIGVLLS